MALGSIFRSGETRRLQQSLVAIARAVPGTGPAGGSHGGRFRSWREIPHSGERPVHALLPGAHLSVPVLPGDVPRGRVLGAAEPLLRVRLKSGGGQARIDARTGAVKA